uniref:Putative reverse transcriptase domain-containing protein n=1 Tax=Tanacetum cinerariifolium TaxID=118510 RepID=A0A699GM40_TANCI|nr:putative reverse transcriptase domain-containing protein [Tanacetum cinerariifolium]
MSVRIGPDSPNKLIIPNHLYVGTLDTEIVGNKELNNSGTRCWSNGPSARPHSEIFLDKRLFDMRSAPAGRQSIPAGRLVEDFGSTSKQTDGCGAIRAARLFWEALSDFFASQIKRVGIFAKKEAPVNFLTDPSDGRSTLRPADVLAALKVGSCEVTKHEKTCVKNQHVFIPFAYDTFIFLAPEAVELLNRVQRVMNSNVMTHRSTNVVFQNISFGIQKGLTAQLVARFPSTATM